MAAARVCGLLLRRLGQPAVIGEMAAGLLLGPIALGAAAPRLHAALFPETSLVALSALSTLGVTLFMFVVGAELRAPEGARAQVKAAGLVAVLGALLPMLLGLAISPWLYPTLAPEGVGYWPFALFMASALSITAFPVLARILKDRGMSRTPVGRLTLGAAAISDVLAWILLAMIVAIAATGDGLASFLKTAAGMLLFCALVFGVLKPLYAGLLRRHAPDGVPSLAVMATLLIGMFACAAITEWLHLHAVFGAFLFGACLPRDDRLLAALIERMEYLAVVALMPVLFAIAGLNTTPDAFSAAGIGALALILAVAVIGKIGGGGLGARMAGMGWRDSLATGALMNARGLMELIVLKVGLDAGLIGPELFTMLFVMAILTTVATGPLLTLCDRWSGHSLRERVGAPRR
nr:cation:proton antiporter [Lysobacter sp. M15]